MPHVPARSTRPDDAPAAAKARDRPLPLRGRPRVDPRGPAHKPRRGRARTRRTRVERVVHGATGAVRLEFKL
jgi:hypothetical protein